MKKLLLPEGMARADRTEFLNTRMRSIVPEICVERARLVTESYQATEGEPYILRRAKALRHLLEHMTIFIDEVNSLPLNVQLLLLRTLQEKEIRRIGSDTVIPLNIRVIAATNKPLIEEVRKGRLREDLFFRLSVLILEVPPLRRHNTYIRAA